LVLYRSTRQIGVRERATEIGISAATLSRIERGHAMDATTLIGVWQWLLSKEPQR
jgi:DNA-binding Xre family transcriptional regulator